MSVTDAEFKQWLGRVCSDNAPYVVNIKDVGSRPQDIYVGRHTGEISDYGNPFEVKDHGRFGAIKRYVIWLGQLDGEARMAYLSPIRAALAEGKQLACYCAPLACHAHVLAGWAMTLDWLVAETRVGTPEGEPGRERSEPSLPSEPPTPEPPTRATATATNRAPRFSSKR